MSRRNRTTNTAGRVLIGVLAAGAGTYWLLRYLGPRRSPLVFNGAVVLITGASSGIGAAYAEAFARRGAKLALTARRTDRLEAVRLAVEPYAADVLVIAADVGDEAGRAAMIDQTLAHYGRIDILINNAGVLWGGPLADMTAPHIEQVINVNLTAVMALTRRALQPMLMQRSGVIVNVASVAGRTAQPDSSVYSGSKHGVIGFSTALRRELEGSGIDVVAVLPGWTKTEMLAPAVEAWVRRTGLVLDDAQTVAESTLNGLLNGQTEIVLGGLQNQLLIALERYFPALADMAIRYARTPEYIALMKADGSGAAEAPERLT